MENKIKIVNFTAPWCSACQMMKPIINQLEEEYKDSELVNIERINVDENTEYAKSFNVRSLPTTLFLVNDVESDRIIGATNKKVILEKISTHLN